MLSVLEHSEAITIIACYVADMSILLSAAFLALAWCHNEASV